MRSMQNSGNRGRSIPARNQAQSMVAGVTGNDARAEGRFNATNAKLRKKSTNAGMVKHKQDSLNMTMDSLINSNLVNQTLLMNQANNKLNESDDELLINDFDIHGTSDAEIDGLNLLRHSKSLLPAEFRD